MTLIKMINQLFGRGWTRVTKKVWLSPTKDKIHLTAEDAYKELVDGKK